MVKQVMLATKLDSNPVIATEQLQKLRYPVLASPKLDGIRGHVLDGVVYSRKNKPLPNRHLQKIFGLNQAQMFDGEIVQGKPNTPNVFNRTQSAVMSIDGEPDLSYYIFDYTNRDIGFDLAFNSFQVSYKQAHTTEPRIKFVYHTWISSFEELMDYEEKKVLDGWEGIMIRDPYGPYKQGRSTLREGWLIKVKRFQDSEAEILGVYEQQTNNNPATVNEVGKSKRGSHQANKINNGRLGGFYVRDLVSNVEFDLGTFLGFTQEWRIRAWNSRKALLGKIVKYKFFPVGVKDKPRQPILLGFRDPIDIGEI